MPENVQQVAYIPMIFPDADFSKGEVNSLPLIKSIDKSVKEIKQDLYECQRAAEQRLSNLERDTSELKNITSKLQN